MRYSFFKCNVIGYLFITNIKRDFSLMVEYETFNLCCMGSNPIGLKLLLLNNYYCNIKCIIDIW